MTYSNRLVTCDMWTAKYPSVCYRCVSLRQLKIGFLHVNRKESGNRFCVSLPNKSIQDLSDHGASKEP